jgi:hypothetical protein
MSDSASRTFQIAKGLSQAWRPSNLDGSWITLALYRGWLITFPISIIAFSILVVAFLLDVLLQPPPISGFAFMLGVAFLLLPQIFHYALWLRLALQRGYWTRKGARVTRADQPVRYWSYVAVGVVVFVVPAAAATALVWFAITS